MTYKSTSEPKRVLMLFSFSKNKLADYDDLVRELNKGSKEYGYQAERGAIKEMEFVIKNNVPTVYEVVTGRDIADNELVFFRMWLKQYERATAAAIYLKHKGVAFFDEDVYNYRAFSKLTETFLMATAGIPVPDTYLSSHKQSLKRFKENPPINYPLIVKNSRGLKGQDNYLVKSYEELVKILAGKPDIDFMIQEFIPNDCDYRFLVLGDEVKLVIKRSRVDAKSHVNNISQGANAAKVPVQSFAPKIIKHVLLASKVMKRNFTGVDVIINKDTGKHYLLEVNNIPEIISVYVEEKVTAIHEYIAKVLKDGNPTKKVIGRKVKVDFPQLGFNGVIAKIDTGAYRGALHCSDIKLIEKEGKHILSFIPLDDNHADYKQTPTELEEYSIAVVRNTSGLHEQRYVINTEIVIDGEKHLIELTLSDRASMRIPVLIGRKFLRDKYIVDVVHKKRGKS